VSSIGIAALVFVSTFVGALLGMRTRRALPAHHLSPETKELVQLCMGLIATMTALILGLVTASAKTAFDAEDTGVHVAAGNAILLDRTLASYGPETRALRKQMREALAARITETWSDGRLADATMDRATGLPLNEIIIGGILALTPQSDAQRWLQSQALSLSIDILKTRMLSLTGNISKVPTTFLAILVFWLAALFWSFGLFAPRNATVFAVLLLATVSVSACVLLIFEMQQPFTGLLRISNEPLRFALEHLGR
jgi:hypothetical protein